MASINTRRVQSGRHNLRVIETGNPTGIPVIFLHGGPGSGLDVSKSELFDERYRIIMFDQRGSGESTPRVVDATAPSDLDDNTLDALIDDMLEIKATLSIVAPWVVSGGSFGSLLAQSFAIRYPEQTAGLLIYAVMLGRKQDTSFFDADGDAALQRPIDYLEFSSALDTHERNDAIAGYEHRFWDDDPERRLSAVKAWHLWNERLYYVTNEPKVIDTPGAKARALTMARLFVHYRRNGFFVSESILANVSALPDVPIRILNGGRDIVTPPDGAQCLYDGLESRPGMQSSVVLTILPSAGHSTSEARYRDAIRDSAMEIADHLESHNITGARSEGS